MSDPAHRGSDLVAALRRLAESIRLGLCKLNEIQFSAPWNPHRTGCG